MTTIEITYGGETVTMTADLAQASAPILCDGESTGYQTADARHRTADAVRLVAGRAWPEVSDWSEGGEAWDELAYGPPVAGRIADDADCDECEVRAVETTCEDCGVTAMITDCGHQRQPRPIAADGHHTYCDDCSDRRETYRHASAGTGARA